MRFLFLAVFALVGASSFSQKTLVFSDKVYEPQIKTVILHPDQNGDQDNLLPAVAAVGQMNLLLEFDDLQSSRNNYYARVIHCNYDWTKSFLMDLDYLHDYNEFPLNDYALSNNTQLPYLHYRFAIPQVKIPGNYLLMIYRDGDKSDLILSRRFMVFTNTTSLIQDNQLSGGGTLRQTNQQLNFTIDYSQMDIMNPVESIHVIIRQNQRWDNAKVDVKPSFVRDTDRQLEFHFFDQDKSFNAGNEFRWVDFRSLSFPGQNTGSINKTVKPFQLYVQQDLPRTDQSYAQYNDYDGNYLIDNKDYGEPNTSGNYVEVTFSLNPLKPFNDPIYVIGAFNNWDRTDENRMKYFPNKAAYETTILLKQGLYNYQYWLDSPSLPANYFEGNHFETENFYEILVYNHAFQPNADLLIGYFVIQVNPR
jgi:Domain of unknown function (DUF5103)